ncbi:hypothetical protein AB7M37_000084 [Sinorhizobium fredii]
MTMNTSNYVPKSHIDHRFTSTGKFDSGGTEVAGLLDQIEALRSCQFNTVGYGIVSIGRPVAIKAIELALAGQVQVEVQHTIIGTCVVNDVLGIVSAGSPKVLDALSRSNNMR